MKLSVIALSAMISFSAAAQTPKQDDKTKNKNNVSQEKKTDIAKKDSVKVLKNKGKGESPNYCPPCGMG